MCAARATALREKEAAAAKERQKAAGGDRKSGRVKSVPANLPEPIPAKGDSRDAVGALFGVSGRSVDHG